jgi:hypothetical protein
MIESRRLVLRIFRPLAIRYSEESEASAGQASGIERRASKLCSLNPKNPLGKPAGFLGARDWHL